VVKTVRRGRTTKEKAAEHPLLKVIAFYKRFNEHRGRCANIVDCFLMLPYHLLLSHCTHKAIAPRFYERQERETEPDSFYGRLIGSRYTNIPVSSPGGYNNSPLLSSTWKEWASATMICMRATVFLTATST
jgi:hypothetical protein